MWPQVLFLYNLVTVVVCSEIPLRVIADSGLKPSLTVTAVIVIFALYLVYGAIYRLFLSPISKFPGPVLAGLTYW